MADFYFMNQKFFEDIIISGNEMFTYDELRTPGIYARHEYVKIACETFQISIELYKQKYDPE